MTSQKSIISTLRSLKPEIAEKFGVKTIGVFGSVVRDDFSQESSDVDIIVEFSRPIGIEFVDLADYLERQIQRKIDLVSRKGVKRKYFEAIEKNIIYV